MQSARLKESAAANYRMKAERHIIPAFGNIQCCLLKAKDVYAFVERKLKDGLSARYLTDITVLLKSVFRYASREYHIKNVLEGIVMPKRSKTEINVLSKEQQAKLERFIGNHANLGTLGVSLSMYMGLRVGEICALL